jgi:hypothetical protein
MVTIMTMITRMTIPTTIVITTTIMATVMTITAMSIISTGDTIMDIRMALAAIITMCPRISTAASPSAPS